MVKKSRLRTQKQKKGRWVILYLLISLILGTGVYQLDQYYGITTYLKDALSSIQKTFHQGGPVRGTLYDRNLRQLAVTLERVSVYAKTREIDSIKETATRLSEVLVMDMDRLEDQLKSGALRLWIAKDINQQQEVSIKNLHLPGVYLQRDEKRYYPNDYMAAHIVGYVEDGIGLSGVEYYYDRLLANRKIKQQEKKQTSSDMPDLVLTIDLKIQDILESIVRDIGKNEQAEKVTAYLLESETGEVIGGASLSGFDPNAFTRYSPVQMENMFLVPLPIPLKFRLFLRDATVLHAQNMNGIVPTTWSLAPEGADLASQLRMWEWLGFEEQMETDFHVPAESGKKELSQQKPVFRSTESFGLVPESATPLQLLTTFSVLLNNGKKIHPFVLKKVLDQEQGSAILLSERKQDGRQSDSWSDADGNIIKALFRSQARHTESNTLFFRDDILVSVKHGGQDQFLVNDLVFVTIPAGRTDLTMLIVVQRPPGIVSKDERGKEKTIEQIVAEKAERISVLQQVSKSVADVVEPEIGGEDNYQGKKRLVTESADGKKVTEGNTASAVMPDIKGLSLRKSLRLLQGLNLNLRIQGTGKVTAQNPLPGTALKGVTECLMILEDQENVSPKKLSKGLFEKN